MADKKRKKRKAPNKFGAFLVNMFKFIIRVILICIIGTMLVNLLMIVVERQRYVSLEEANELEDVDCIVVLGCSVKNGKPSYMLKDRLDKTVELYNSLDIKPVILCTGDHKSRWYNEVNVMKDYLIDAGIPSSKIFLDHAGYNTYDSFYRAKNTFDIEKAIVVTQSYHLYRSLYIAKSFGIDAYGVPAKKISYVNQWKREIREILARNKDFLWCIFKPEAEVTGDKVNLSDSGDSTDIKVVED